MFQCNLSKNLSFWCRNQLFLPQIQEGKHKWIWGYVRVRVTITIFSYPQNFPKIFLGSQKFFGEYQRFFPCPRKIENPTSSWVVLLFWQCVVEFIIGLASNDSENPTKTKPKQQKNNQNKKKKFQVFCGIGKSQSWISVTQSETMSGLLLRVDLVSQKKKDKERREAITYAQILNLVRRIIWRWSTRYWKKKQEWERSKYRHWFHSYQLMWCLPPSVNLVQFYL